MCGRYGLEDPDKIYERFDVTNRVVLKPRYNIAPSQNLPIVVISGQGNRKVELMRWGLLPSWASDPKLANMMVNARAETINKKPSYAKPLKHQRCLIPASYFFEWKQTKEGKIPYLIKLKNDEIFAFAGVFDINEKVEDRPLKTYTIITTEPNEMVGEIHNRMPVILNRASEKIWLDPQIEDTEKLMGLLKPFPANLMEAYPVFTTVNDPKNDIPDVTQPIPKF